MSDGPLGGFRVNDSVVAKVFTVVELSEQNKKDLARALEDLIGRRVRIVNKLDPSLIAGMIITTADLVIDLSMKSRLEKLSESIHQRIHEEFSEGKEANSGVFFDTTA